MSESINWILLTDLHLGLDNESWLWPKVKHELFRDIGKITDQIGVLDLVFFTGDFTQSAEPLQFSHVTNELEGLWKLFAQHGSEPLLCPVPGNHDLTRPPPVSAVSRALTNWWTDEVVRQTFWRDSTCEYRKAVVESFRNYTSWLSQLPVPLPVLTSGALPGDFSAVFRKRDVQLGIIGLNSTFLKIADGDFRGKLDLHVSQLNAVCSGDPDSWLKQQTANILLTHQPQSWLAPEPFEHYRQELYPPGRFLAHLYGHQHEPEVLDMSEAGGHPRRFRQGSSVFGLKQWSGVTPTQRIHGYMAGQYVFDGADSKEKIWPRIAIRGRDGGLIICPDHTFRLQANDAMVTPFELPADDEDASPGANTLRAQTAQRPEDAQTDATPSVDLHLLDKPPDPETSRNHLAPCPRLTLCPAPHHRAIRQEEQTQFELELRKGRSVWLVADWGTGKDGFLSAALERFRVNTSVLDVFHLRCDEADDENSFQALFPQQFGMAMQAFCGYAASLVDTFLLFDGIHPSLSVGENITKLGRIAAAILDYSPELRIVFISRTPPDKGVFPSVELHPLDVPDVRTYVLHHPDATVGLRDPDVIAQLHERSDGLPMHLDRMFQSLKVSSLETVLDAEMEGPSAKESSSETVPRALVHAVTTLAKSVDRRSQRSFRLLQVLSVLPYGETLETLHHYLPNEPFFIENALQLNELGLLDAIPLQQHASPSVGFGRCGLSDESAPKILKVPRQIGGYVLTRLSDDERAEIVLSGVDRFFGRRWREGKVKLRTLPFEYREYLSTGAGNEFAVVHHLIVDARNHEDLATARKAARLGVQYCHHLSSEERYRDLTIVAGGLLQTIGRDDMPEQWSELAMLHGAALRMIGKTMEALRYLQGALETGEKHFHNDQKASVWLDTALAEETLKHSDLAVKAAAEVRRFTEPDSASSLHAVALEAGLTLKGTARTERLRELEKQARDQGNLTLADNITLDLAHDMDAPDEEIRLLDRVLATKERGYNRTRAVVAKAQAVEKRQDHQMDLTTTDLVALSSAYSYLHSQRFGALFDKCHASLWNLLESRGDTPQLLRLFRHTSFVWRIRGNETEEAAYLKRLVAKSAPSVESQSPTGLLLEVRYFLRRLSLVVHASSPAGAGTGKNDEVLG